MLTGIGFARIIAKNSRKFRMTAACVVTDPFEEIIIASTTVMIIAHVITLIVVVVIVTVEATIVFGLRY